MDAEERKFLLQLARRAIEHYLATGSRLEIEPSEVPKPGLVEKRACFVTLKKGEELRGCIGSLEAHQPLFKDVIENALKAAFGDPRFYPLTSGEFEKITISISVLTKPKPFPVKGPGDLLEKLIPGKHGLILQQGVARSTFLPVVWEQLPEKIQFLEHLSTMAGLNPDGWKDPRTRFFVYEAEEFSES